MEKYGKIWKNMEKYGKNINITWKYENIMWKNI